MSTPPRGAPTLDTVEQLRARLAEVAERKRTSSGDREHVVSAERWQLRERVVLLDYFTARSLEGRSGRAVGSSVDEFVTNDCELVTTRGDSAWRLRLDVRRETLSRLGVPGARRAAADDRDGIPAGKDDVAHRMAVQLLGPGLALDWLSAADLSGVLRAREWLAGLPIDLPPETDVLRALDLANVLEPLRAVAGIVFVGRQDELELLEQYVGSSASRGGTAEPEPVGLFGPGGVGKSTLIARFVLGHVEGAADPLPFAYLTFDRADLDPQFPLTLVREVCRQLALQAPAQAEFLAAVQRDLDSVLASQVARRREFSASRGGTATRDISRDYYDEDNYLKAIGSSLLGAFHGRPLLLVLDTFEVAQRRDRSGLTRLRSTLRSMSKHMPVRIVIAGRAEPVDLTSFNRPLAGLDAVDAMSLLRKALGSMRVDDALLADVIDRVSGNPLSLRLAADLMVREGETALATPRGRRRFLFGLREEQVQGILYRRILEHVDKRVRPLANPGLVVRLITPGVIERVLAKPCGLGRVTPGQAQVLYGLLRDEASLVSETRPGVLAHRPDVRAEVLPLLMSEDPDRVEEIHRRAVRYYGDRLKSARHVDDVTEHLYHRLMLGQTSATLDRHWVASAGPLLESALSELPPSSRVYLAGKLGVEVDPADLVAADETAWVRQATRQSRKLLDAGQPREALDVLARGAPDAEGDGLGGGGAGGGGLRNFDADVAELRVEALAALGHRDAAAREARAALATADQLGLATDYVELGIVAGRVAEDDENFTAARQHFEEAYLAARDVGLGWAVLTAGVGVLRMSRRSGASTRADASAFSRLRSELIEDVSRLSDRDKALHPGLLRELAAELGDVMPQLLIDASEHVGITSAGDDTAGHDAETLNVIQQNIVQTIADRPDVAPELPVEWTFGSPGDEHADNPFDLLELSSSTQGHVVAEAIKGAPENSSLHESLTKYWQGEADRPSYDYNADS